MSEENSISFKKNFFIATYEAAAFTMTRYPYLCAVLMMVTTAEESKTRQFDRTAFNYIYAHLGVAFVGGTLLSFDMFGLKRWTALAMAVQTIVISYDEYTLTKGEQIAMRLLCRNLGIIGCYLSVAGGIAKNKGAADKNKYLLTFGRQLIGAYTMLTAVLIWNSEEEFSSHAKALPGGALTVYIYIAVYMMCSICIYSGYEVVKMCKLLMCLLFAITLIVDMDVKMWTKHAGIGKWKTMTIAARHVPIISILLLIRDGYY
ncbi:uncharacterized protein LOC130636044 [Hydractinia symbiolongicarpus]|uniref:uncharacterized protein LOC130636044 n=1 Tax=Hydractinia symbiolongicarpus TaxID=13093 RepID=UPI00254C6046|nr:uncharacterized protein LOC130636044 [Hydractinia symbiolongicarpus]